MAVLVSSLESEFTPAVGVFIVSVSGAPVTLWRKNDAAAPFVQIHRFPFSVELEKNGTGVDVTNSVVGAVYKFTGEPSSVVRANQ